MGTYVGADWASNGWIVAKLDDEGLEVGFYPTIWNLWHAFEDDPDQILVDIPIGLPENERRPCDSEAQNELGGQASSVFLTPIREAVYEDNIEKAKEKHEEADADYSIQNQVWGIVPRIREVDTFLLENEDAQAKIRESHPEVCFRKLADTVLPKKSTEDGIAERKDVLCENDSFTESEVNEELDKLTKPDYFPCAAEDDVLDAIVLAATAKHVAEGDYAILPRESESGEEHPPEDEEGLPMEIVYPTPGPRNP